MGIFEGGEAHDGNWGDAMTIENLLMLDKDLNEWKEGVMERRHEKGGRRHHAKYLFKYFSEASPYTLPNLRDILVESRMRFSSRTEFNDPFDSYFEILPPDKPEEVHEYFRRVALRRGLSGEEAQAMADKTLAKGDWLSEFNAAQARVLDRTGIICFAETPASMLMWSHYGESHKGVVVVFRIVVEADAFLGALPACYGNEFPRFKFNTFADSDATIRALLYKSEQWHYEFEWRLLKVEGAGTYQQLRKDIVCGVVFGCKAKPEFIDNVCDLIQIRQAAELPAIRIDRMQLRTDTFELDHLQMVMS